MKKFIISLIVLIISYGNVNSQGLYTFADKTTTIGISGGGYTLNNSSNYGPTGEIVLSINGAFDIGGRFAYRQFFPDQNPGQAGFMSDNKYSAFINWYMVKCNLSKIKIIFALGAEGAYFKDNLVTNVEGVNVYTANANATFGMRFDFAKKKMFLLPNIVLGTEFYRNYTTDGVNEIQSAFNQTIYGISRIGFDWGYTVGKSSSIIASFKRTDNGRFGEGFSGDLRLVMGF